MGYIHGLVKYTPRPIINIFKSFYAKYSNKYSGELLYWKTRFEMENGKFGNEHYKKIMLAIAGREDEDFIQNKVIADFGCGPRGSLTWAKSAKLRIGIDVIADKYADEFKDNIINQDMIYLKCTEKVIPLPSNFIDIMFTINAIDHVDSFDVMCKEVIRVIKPGGIFVGSFNLEEPPTLNEPQSLNEDLIKQHLLDHFQILNYRLSRKGPREDLYQHFYSNELSYDKGEEGILWVTARK